MSKTRLITTTVQHNEPTRPQIIFDISFETDFVNKAIHEPVNLPIPSDFYVIDLF